MNTTVLQLRTILKYTYGLVPMIAGLDKHTNLLTDWGQYISPGISEILPFDTGTLMMLVGPIEILAGILVLFRPKIGAVVVGTWLIAIALVLILGGHYFDVAVRDLVMAIGAFTLAKLMEMKIE